MRGDAVFFQQRFLRFLASASDLDGQEIRTDLGEVKLKWVIRAERDVESILEEIREGIPFVGEKERVVR